MLNLNHNNEFLIAPTATYNGFSLAGYTFYKLIFNLTEQQSAQSYQNPVYSHSVYPGSYYSMCTPVIQSVNDLLRETVGRFLCQFLKHEKEFTVHLKKHNT